MPRGAGPEHRQTAYAPMSEHASARAAGPQRKPREAAVVSPATAGAARIDEVKEARPCETGRCASVPGSEALLRETSPGSRLAGPIE